MSVTVTATVTIGETRVAVPVTLDDDALATIAAAVADDTNGGTSEPSPYMSVREAAEYMRCSRQRIDDLLSQRRLTRFKDGSRTLVRRDEIEVMLTHTTTRRTS
ncbi:MAG: helix-turn-helix domain-containing protein [Gaiellaceae bacterium]